MEVDRANPAARPPRQSRHSHSRNASNYSRNLLSCNIATAVVGARHRRARPRIANEARLTGLDRATHFFLPREPADPSGANRLVRDDTLCALFVLFLFFPTDAFQHAPHDQQNTLLARLRPASLFLEK